MGFVLRLMVPLVMVFLVVGCDSRQVDGDRPGGIDWFEGEVDEAFALAEQQDKPIFLYWGAAWCPPCQELKGTIFKQQAFIDQSRLFIPVYLDGDTEQAQLYGEKFSVYGYPTVIVFSPQGAEITRIPGGMDIQRYLSVLELAINAITPVKKLVAAVKQGDNINPADWKLLAFYAWSQDRGKVLAADDDDQSRFGLFKLLAETCPADLVLAKSRLQMLAIEHWSVLDTEDKTNKALYLNQFTSILSDPALSNANSSSIIYGAADLSAALTKGAQLIELRVQLSDHMAAISTNSEFNLPLRLSALSGWVALQNASLAEAESLADDKLSWISQRVSKGLGEADSYEYHSAVNTLSQTLYDAGLVEDAKLMLVNSLTITKHPYYLMSDLGFMEAQLGNNQQSLNWYKKAWDSSKGPATRIQWGVNYVVNLVELAPEDIAGISLSYKAIIAELAEQNNGLHQRTAVRMGNLSDALESWADSPAKAQIFAEFKEALSAL